jgi:hypothetical protein
MPARGGLPRVYTLLSLAPLVVVLVAEIGIVYGREAAQGRLVGQLQRKCCKPISQRARHGSTSTSGNVGETEEPGYECHLPNDVVLRQPSHLSFADHVHRLDTLNGSPRRIERAKPLTGSNAPFDRSVILLHDVVQVAHRPASQRRPSCPAPLSSPITFG